MGLLLKKGKGTPLLKGSNNNKIVSGKKSSVKKGNDLSRFVRSLFVCLFSFIYFED